MTALNRAVVVLSITLVIAWGSVYYAFGLTAPLIAAELGQSRPFTYAGFSLTLVVAGLASPFIGRAVDRSGGRAIMAAGSLVAALGLTLLGAAKGEAAFFLACAVCGVGMAMTFYDAAFASLNWLTKGHARQPITLVTLAGGFASTVFWPITQALLQHVGWREVYFIYAALQALLCAPLLFVGLAAKPAAVADAPQGVCAAEPPALTGSARWQAFALLALAVVMQGFVNSGMGIHLLPALASLGAEPSLALFVGSLLGPAQVTGRLLDLAFGRRLLQPLALGVVALGAMPLAFLMLLGLPVSTASLSAYAVLYGLGNGLMTIARGLIPAALFGRDSYGAMLGLLAAPGLMIQAAAPTALALIVDSWGVVAMLKLCVALAALAFLFMATLAWRFGPPRRDS
ncbi:MFS transporter [Terrarubrum flagellatum]|uniref:MFS transporter n=1 Tax=Terrirubrum flagellatum TaxID=2895980 RepID=UPI00314541F4